MVYAEEILGLEKTYFVLLVLIIAILILAVFYLYMGITFVDSKCKKIVERNGRYKKTLEPGIRFVLPFVEKVVANVDTSFQMIRNSNDLKVCLDGKNYRLKYSASYRVICAKDYYYSSCNFAVSIEDACSAFLLSYLFIGGRLQTEELNLSGLNKNVQSLGISIRSLSIVSVELLR